MFALLLRCMTEMAQPSNPEPRTSLSDFQTLTPQPQTPNPKPETLISTPHTPHQTHHTHHPPHTTHYSSVHHTIVLIHV